MISLHPAIPFFLAAALSLFPWKPFRGTVQLAAPLVSFYFFQKLAGMPAVNEPLALFGYEAYLYRIDPLSTLFIYAFLIFSFLANVYALHSDKKYIAVASSLYAGSSIGAVLAGDLATLFVFWELMALTSAVLIWNPERKQASGAFFRYILVHFTGGLFFFAGMMLHFIESGSLIFDTLYLTSLSGKLIFIGFAVNAAIPPLHAWMADAYPEGTPEGSIYLSCFTSKTAVFVMARGFAGEEWLIYLGAAAAIYGVLFALMENDIRRLLSYHIICQVGYMLCGIGIGTELGINGGTGHAIGNIFFKGLLFMATGAILHQTGFTKLSDLGGLAKRNKTLLFFYMVGALAIAGMPYLNGHVTKSLLVKAATYEHIAWLEITLLVVAVGTFLSIGCKLAYFAFWGEEKDEGTVPSGDCPPLPLNMTIAMSGLTALCVLLGVNYELLYSFLPYAEHANVYTLSKVIHTFQLLAGTWLGFTIIASKLHTKDVITLDTDWFYRAGGKTFVSAICRPIKTFQERVQSGWTRLLQSGYENIQNELKNQSISPVSAALTLMTSAILVLGCTLLFLK